MSTSCPAVNGSSSPSCPRGQWTQIFFCWTNPRPIWTSQPRSATQQLKEILLALKKQGKTLLLSEHRLYYLADIADEFWVMADGEIKGKYTATEAKAFSAEQRQILSLRTLDLAEITVPEKEPLPKTAPMALAVSDVRYTYGRKAGDTLSGVSFSVREHEIVGLVGAKRPSAS